MFGIREIRHDFTACKFFNEIHEYLKIFTIVSKNLLNCFSLILINFPVNFLLIFWIRALRYRQVERRGHPEKIETTVGKKDSPCVCVFFRPYLHGFSEQFLENVIKNHISFPLGRCLTLPAFYKRKRKK